MIYDVVTCVGKKHVGVAAKAIPSLLLFTDARKIFIISPLSTLDDLKSKLGDHCRLCFIDENLLIDPAYSKRMRKQFIEAAKGDDRFGWYLQQFLKMGASELPDLSEYYLIWDSDTILLKEVDFFDEDGKVLVSPAAEHHKPYFQLINKTLGFGRQVNYSFISEHLMIKKEYMRLLINKFANNSSPNTTWMEFILSSIDNKNLPRSGFSEYETYGNFVALKFKESFLCRKIKSTRFGTMIYGEKIDRYVLFDLMRSGYTYVTFETWHSKPAKLKRLIQAGTLRISWIQHWLTRGYSGQLRAAAELDR